MKPETLISITAPASRTPDGSHAPTMLDLIDRQNWFQRGKGTENGRMRWSPPKGDRTTKKPAWTIAEAAIACRGLDERHHNALRFEFALDDSAFYPLQRALLIFAVRQRTLQRWPRKVITLGGTVEFLPELITMHLIEVRQPWRFKRTQATQTPPMWQVLMNVDDATWRKKLSPIYETIGDEYKNWRDIGLAKMWRTLRED